MIFGAAFLDEIFRVIPYGFRAKRDPVPRQIRAAALAVHRIRHAMHLEFDAFIHNIVQIPLKLAPPFHFMFGPFLYANTGQCVVRS
jgi:hypothetical protein